MAVFVLLECGPAGVSIEQVAAEMTSVAKRLDLAVQCGFNGITLQAGPSTSINDVLNEYQDSIAFERRVRRMTEDA